MNRPVFSIVIPTYNRAHIIEQTINSCVNQDFDGNYEILIIDDGSTDQTSSLIKNLGIEHLKYYKVSNRERGAARNYGTKMSSGEYITFLDSDDIFHSTHLSNAKEFLQLENSPEIFHLGYQIIDSNLKIIKEFNSVPGNNLNIAILGGNYMSCMGVFMRKDIADAHPFSENRQLSGSEDWLLWLQLAARYKIKFSQNISASMIDHDGRSIKNFSAEELDKRTSLITESLKKDKKFLSVYGMKSLNRIHAHMLTYSGLHLILSKKKLDGWKRFCRGVMINPVEIFTRRTLAIFKHSL